MDVEVDFERAAITMHDDGPATARIFVLGPKLIISTTVRSTSHIFGMEHKEAIAIAAAIVAKLPGLRAHFEAKVREYSEIEQSSGEGSTEPKGA